MATHLDLDDVAAQSPLALRELQELRAAILPAPRWWRCDTHGPATANAWGCPECVREMRGEIARLVRERDYQRQKLLQLLELAQEVRLIDATGSLPDGDVVNGPTSLWAEDWTRRLATKEPT